MHKHGYERASEWRLKTFENKEGKRVQSHTFQPDLKCDQDHFRCSYFRPVMKFYWNGFEVSFFLKVNGWNKWKDKFLINNQALITRPVSVPVNSWTKGAREISEAFKKLKIPSLQLSRQHQRMRLLMRILSKEEVHPALMQSYDNLIMDGSDNSIQTQREPISIQTNNNFFHSGFLLRTMRDL